MAHGPPGEDGGVAEEMRGHRCSLLLVQPGVRTVSAFAGVADDREEDVFEGGLLLDVLDLGGRQQLLELGQGAVDDDPALVEDRDPVGKLLGLVRGTGW